VNPNTQFSKKILEFSSFIGKAPCQAPTRDRFALLSTPGAAERSDNSPMPRFV